MKKWRISVLVALPVLLLATSVGAQDYSRLGASLFVDYNMPVLSLRKSWYDQSTKWGASLLYSMSERMTMEFEYHRATYRDGKIQGRTFTWAVDNQPYESPLAASDMTMNSAVVNFMFRMGDQSDLFMEQMASFYVLFGAGFFDYNNRVRGLIYPAQTAEPLDPNMMLEPDRDTRTGLGINVGCGVEYFLTQSLALDFRLRHNVILGHIKPREAWGIKEAWPLQMLDLGVAVKFYASSR